MSCTVSAVTGADSDFQFCTTDFTPEELSQEITGVDFTLLCYVTAAALNTG